MDPIFTLPQSGAAVPRDILISGGVHSGTGHGGHISISAGDNDGTGDGGDITICSGGPGTGGTTGSLIVGASSDVTHIISIGTVPGITVGTIDASSTDVAGIITMPAGLSTATVTYSKTYNCTAFSVVITPRGVAATPLFVPTATTTGFTLTNPAGNAGVDVSYQVIGLQ